MNAAGQDASTSQLNTVFIGLISFWSAVIVGFAAWSYWQLYTATVEIARASAYESLSKDLVYRRWATLHGGVYVPVTPETPPNPDLADVPERDISTPSGKKLTLINPAYMTRQVHQLAKKDFGSRGHITSLKPIRPENVPDEWEKHALQAFERGAKEVSSLEPIGDQTYMRFMRPLFAEAGCLKCHAKQGYKIGDIRGGLSVSVPWSDYRQALRSELLVHVFGLGGIWALGILGLRFGRNRIQDNMHERRRASQELRESEERHRTILQTAMDGFWLADTQGRLLDVNEAYCRMSGYGRQELLAMRISDLEAAESPEDTAAHMKKVMAHSEDRFESRHRRKDGSIFDVTVSAQFQAVDGGRFVIFLQDYTERRRSEQALHESEEQFRGLVEQSIAGIYIIQDGRFSYANPRFAEICGYASADEIVGRDALSMVVDKDRGPAEEYVRRLLAGELRSIPYTFSVLRKDGNTIEVGAHAACANYKGRPAVIGLIQDISEKRRAEEKIQSYLEQLKTAFMRTVEVATTLSEMRDPYTAGHERRVAEIAVAIGAELGFDVRRQEGMRVAGYLHDIGKITIPAEILSKPGKLSAIEYSLIQAHAQASHDALKNVQFPWPVAEVALQHHERMDGSGYPQGLKGGAIMLEARIVAVADVIEAMSSHRPYRPGLGIASALAEIERGRGTAYDPAVADAALKLFREKGYAIPA
ncbi:MAG: PAS domain S-box protein [Burkholderiales bacterium]|nr:PAS domain S-box protein [Burkholderiales bacterium]